MICPKCQNNSIPFARVWLKSGLGTYRCPGCGAVSRVRKSVPMFVASMCFAAVAVIVGFLFRTWLAFGIAVAVIVIIEALMDYRLRRLELVETKHEESGA